MYISFHDTSTAANEELQSLRDDVETLQKHHKPKEYKMDGYTYRIYYDKKSWDHAQEICQHWGGHLAVILDKKMRDYVHSIMPETAWIGLTDRWAEGEWQTWDRKKVTYWYWREGEPNNGQKIKRKNEHCAAKVETNEMNDEECSKKLGFICQSA